MNHQRAMTDIAATTIRVWRQPDIFSIGLTIPEESIYLRRHHGDDKSLISSDGSISNAIAQTMPAGLYWFYHVPFCNQ